MDPTNRPLRPVYVDEGSPADATEPSRLKSGRAGGDWLAYLQLFRAPNVFTAIADVAMGYLITTQSLAMWPGFLLLVSGSALLYTAGMVLNDVFDVEVDREERPGRPLPSGRISVAWARWLGVQFMVMGWAAASLAGFSSDRAPGPPWRAAVVAIALCFAILLYDGWAKKSRWFGPWVMGGCRFLNVLLGMSLSAAPSNAAAGILGYDVGHLCVALGIGTYIAGVTYFARGEATESPRSWLAVGIGCMAAGLACLALFPRWSPDLFPYRYEITTTWPMAWLMMSVWILRRALLALRDPGSGAVQGAVKLCILSLIVIDAMVCSLVCDWPYAVGIVSLLVPTVLLGRWVYST